MADIAQPPHSCRTVAPHAPITPGDPDKFRSCPNVAEQLSNKLPLELRFGPSSTHIGRCAPAFDQLWPLSSDQNWARFCQHWPDVSQVRPKLDAVGKGLAHPSNIGWRSSADIAQISPESDDFGRNFAQIGQSGSNFGPNLAGIPGGSLGSRAARTATLGRPFAPRRRSRSPRRFHTSQHHHGYQSRRPAFGRLR